MTQKILSKKKPGAAADNLATAPGFLYGYKCFLLRSRSPILRGKVLSPYHLRKRLSEPLKSRLFSPLLRNKSASFPHALRCLSAVNALPAIRAVFDAVRGGRKERAALDTLLFVLGVVKFRKEQLIKGKYGNPKPLAKQRIGNELRADTFLPVVKQNTVSAIAVAALPAYKGIDFPALGRREPLNRNHASSAA